MALKPPELKVTFQQEPWSSHEIEKNKMKIPFLLENFVQEYPKYDVNNVRLPDIVGPTSYIWFTWRTGVKSERDKKKASRPTQRHRVKTWDFNADERLSESGDPRFDIASIDANQSAAAKKAMGLTKLLQPSCHHKNDCIQPILSAKEVMTKLGQINRDDTGTQNPSTSVDSASAAPKPIRVGTDCSGMESPIQALEGMRMPFDHVFACDKDPDSKKTIESNWNPATFYPDITTRDNSISPEVDLYTAGFPCQPFSRAGKQEGFYDAKGNGTIFHFVHDYIVKTLPKVFVLENVDGIVSIDNGECLRVILKALESVKAPLGSEIMKKYDHISARMPIYEIHWKVLNALDNGVPQNRKRWYCIGLRKDQFQGGLTGKKSSFAWPESIPCPPMSDFLDDWNCLNKPHHSASQSPSVHRNIQKAKLKLISEGKDPNQLDYVIDCFRSSAHYHNFSPCITRSRDKGHWITSRNRLFNKQEMFRLQGMDPTIFKISVSQTSLGQQIGNAMSVNVVERVIQSTLKAVGLLDQAYMSKSWLHLQLAAGLG